MLQVQIRSALSERKNVNSLNHFFRLLTIFKPFSFLSKVAKHNIWTFAFETERESALSEELLATDFDLVPVIKSLTETILNNSDAFRTKDSSAQNIVFKLADKEELAQ